MLEGKNEWARLLNPENRKYWLAAAAILFVFLLLGRNSLASSAKKAKQTGEESAAHQAQSYEHQLEERLTVLISQISGAGKVTVMVTVANGGTDVYAKNNEDGQSIQKKSYVVTQGGQALLEKTELPEVTGAAIVCEGGDNSAVKSAITEAVCALLGIPSNHVSISKMK